MWKLLPTCATILLVQLAYVKSDELLAATAEPDFTDLEQQVDDLQTQVYILSGVFGGVCFFLLCVVAFQCAALQSIKKNSKSSMGDNAPTTASAHHNNPTFQSGPQDIDELSVRGFAQYPNSEASVAQPVQDRFRTPRYHDERKPTSDTSVDSRYGQLNQGNPSAGRSKNYPPRDSQLPRSNPGANNRANSVRNYEDSYGYY